MEAYTKRYFVTRMTTTSKNKEMNNFIDEYVNALKSMKEFVINCQKDIEKQFQRERKKPTT